jgi:hypothetical protein
MHQSDRNQSRLGKRDFRPAAVRLRVKLAPMKSDLPNPADLPNPGDQDQSEAVPTEATDLDQSAARQESSKAPKKSAPDAAPDWQTSVDQIYDRKTKERRPLREGDPQNFRQTAAEITSRQQDLRSARDLSNPHAKFLVDDATELVLDRFTDELIDDRTADLLAREALPLTTEQYESLHLPMHGAGYAHWRQIVGETFLEHQMTLHDRASQQVDMVLGRALWQILQQFGIEAAYVFLLLAAKATRSRNPWEELVELHTAELLHLNIWDKAADAHVGRRLKAVGNWVELVCNLSLLLTKVNPETQKFKALRIPFWVMEEMEYSGRVSRSAIVLGGYQPEESQDLTVRVGFGLWSEQFVDVPDEQKREALGRFGYQANSVLQINPIRKSLAASLAILLLLLNQSDPDRFYSVGALLEQVESKATLIEMQRRKDRRNYFWSRWNTALHTLQKLGWQIEFDPQTYPEMLQPAWQQSDAPSPLGTDADRWVRSWLQAKIRIQPPQLPIAPIDQPDLPLSERFTGRTLAQALALKGMSRSKLAEHLSLDRSMVTYWIKGSRLIQPRHREQICGLLGEELALALAQS